MVKIAIVFALLSVTLQTVSSGVAVFCYFGEWSGYRGNGSFVVKDLTRSKNMCTHWIYGSVALLSNGTIVSFDNHLDYDLDYLNQINTLKKKCNVKTILSVGGWRQSSSNFSKVVSNEDLRRNFVQSALNWTLKYGFDGFDIDWEIPAQKGGAKEDKENFPVLLKDLRAVFSEHNLILTVAVEPLFIAENAYDVPLLSKYLDYITVKAFNLRSVNEGYTVHDAALYQSPDDNDATSNVNQTVQSWIQRGADPTKLVLGVPSFGRTFTLKNESITGLGAPTVGPGRPGRYTKLDGTLAYFEICEYLASKDWNVVWEKELRVPYAYKGNQWIGYDNRKSVAAKLDYAIGNGLAGVMLWSIDMDDFGGRCGARYSLMREVRDALIRWSIYNENTCTEQ